MHLQELILQSVPPSNLIYMGNIYRTQTPSDHKEFAQESFTEVFIECFVPSHHILHPVVYCVTFVSLINSEFDFTTLEMRIYGVNKVTRRAERWKLWNNYRQYFVIVMRDLTNVF